MGTNDFDNWKKKTALFLTSQNISLFGSSLVQYVITWYITLSTKSGVLMTVSILCGSLPIFVMAPFTGVWADRYSRKKLIALSNSMIAIVTLVMAVLFSNGYNSIWLIFILSVLRAFGSSIQIPVMSAVLPQLVPQDKLTRINGVNGSILSVINLASLGISGVLFTVIRTEYIFFIAAATAVIAVIILLLFIDIPLHAKALLNEKKGYLKDLKLGIGYVKDNPFLKYLFLFYGIFYVLIAPTAYLPNLEVVRNFGGDAWRLAATETAFLAGMIISGAVIASRGGFKNRIHTLITAFLLLGGSTIALGLVNVFWFYLCLMVLTGVALPLLNTPSTVLLQEKTEENYLGRVFGIWTMLSTSMMQLSMLIFGPAADFVKIEWIQIGTGTLLLILGLVLCKNKVLRKGGEAPFK